MSIRQDDPLFDSLDRLARIADADVVGDRLPDIRQRVRRARRRRAVGAGVAWVALVAGVVVWAAQPGHDPAPQPAPQPTPQPTPQPPQPTPSVRVGHHAMRVVGTGRADVDGDGRVDRVELLVPRRAAGAEQRLRVELDAGGTLAVALPDDATPKLERAVDLDGDGRAELVVSASGGEFLSVQVVAFDGRGLVRLASPVAPSGWEPLAQPDGIYSFRFADPSGDTPPAAVLARRWTLSGGTLGLDPSVTPGCLRTSGDHYEIGPGGC